MRRMRISSWLAVVVVVVVAMAAGNAGALSITGLTLINADANTPVAGFDPIPMDAVINLAELPTRNLNLRANPGPGGIGSVRFGYDENANHRTENTAPYALAGDLGGDYYGWTPATGEHRVSATPYPEANAGGTPGDAATVRFGVSDHVEPEPGDVLVITGQPPIGGAFDPAGTGPSGGSGFAATAAALGLGVDAVADDTFVCTDDALAPYVIVVFASNDRPFTPAEQAAVERFVEAGGGIAAFADDGAGEAGIASDNDVLTPFAMSVGGCASEGETVATVASSGHYLVDGLSIRAEGACEIAASGGDAAVIASCPADGGAAAIAVATAGLGRAAAVFDTAPLVNGDGDAPGIGDADNGEFAKRLLLWLAQHEPTGAAAGIDGEMKTWHRVELTFAGPPRSEHGGINPFLDYRVEVEFAHDGRTITVPGFFAADGDAGESGADHGRAWRIRFAPDAPGRWRWTASFRHGEGIAAADNPAAGMPVSFSGSTGSFDVAPTDKTGRDLRGRGLLRYVNGHYLEFAGDGAPFLKGGADSPENFLGYADFDGTFDTGGIIDGFLHRYEPHERDWRPGDPTWRGGKGKGIIGALNYLASQGGNSVYFLTYNIDGGDGADTWPWTDPSVRDRFDCSKLDQWEKVFTHMDRLGIQLHVVTQENENDLALDGGELGPVRRLYYRELVARFAHHLAVQWNLGEENRNGDAQRRAFAAWIRGLDPYDHPIVVHTWYDHADTFYDGLLGDASFEGTSVQGNGARYNEWARELRERSAAAGRPWAVYGDEQGPAVAADMGNLDELRRTALWGNLMGGGAGVEWYFGYQGDFGDMQSEDWRRAEPLWAMTRHALEFFTERIPVAKMAPANDLVSAPGAWALATPGRRYAVYLPGGGTTQLDLGSHQGPFRVRWFDPRSGGDPRPGTVQQVEGPGAPSLGYPPSAPDADWAVVVESLDEGSVFGLSSRFEPGAR